MLTFITELMVQSTDAKGSLDQIRRDLENIPGVEYTILELRDENFHDILADVESPIPFNFSFTLRSNYCVKCNGTPISSPVCININGIQRHKLAEVLNQFEVVECPLFEMVIDCFLQGSNHELYNSEDLEVSIHYGS